VGVDGMNGELLDGDSVAAGEGSGLRAEGGRGSPEGTLEGGEKNVEMVGRGPTGDVVGVWAAGLDVRSHTSKLTCVR